jgi:Cd2+/Zn2+-exporting ATPase
VNQATITGESLPADKAEGDEAFSGTINLTGVLEIEVTKAGSDTTLGRVKDMILQAERTRIPIMRMIDRYAVWYTPTILMIVAIVLFFSLKLGLENPWERAISMLVIACPCALILATPTAMVAALSAAARLGVLVKSVVDLEAARNLTAMIFDKTGTLTTGQLQVTRIEPVDGDGDRTARGMELLRAAAIAEQHSRHPVARAVTDVARRAKLMLAEPASFEEVSGRGVKAVVDGQSIVVGRANWLAAGEAGALAPDAVTAIRATQNSPETEGLSTLFVVRDGRLLGWIGLEDNTRPQAAAAMDKLRELGLKRLIIVTGDRESVAKRVAGAMHTDYKAEVLPHQKLEMVDELKGKGHRVAVIGDGVNDAPALAAGDISIAMGAAGSDVAIHSASIALMNNNLNRIPFLVQLSRMTSAVIRQNLAIGVLFIIIGEIAAAMNYVSPILAAVLHVVSGLVVIFNSARLVRAGEDIEMAEAPATVHQRKVAEVEPQGQLASA